jgi:hypothetical protein
MAFPRYSSNSRTASWRYVGYAALTRLTKLLIFAMILMVILAFLSMLTRPLIVTYFGYKRITKVVQGRLQGV